MTAIIKTTYNYIVYPLSALVFGLTMLLLMQPEGEMFRMFTQSAIEFMLGILGFGIVCMLLKWHRLMFVSFVCTGIVCLFLKSSINPSPAYAESKVEDLRIVQLNVSNYDGHSYEDLTDLLKVSEADLISIQEITPDWDSVFRVNLQETFPHYSSVASLGFNGIAVYSKHPISHLDTFFFENIPNLTGVVDLDRLEKPVRFISTYTNPSFKSESAYQHLRKHFKTIIDKVKEEEETKLAFGSYNTVAWSSEMQFFTTALDLHNSRRSINNPFTQSTYEHIFHSPEMECAGLVAVTDSLGNNIGMEAKLHFKREAVELGHVSE